MKIKCVLSNDLLIFYIVRFLKSVTNECSILFNIWYSKRRIIIEKIMDEGINHCIGQNTINSRGDPACSRSLKMLMVVAQLFCSGIYQYITGKV